VGWPAAATNQLEHGVRLAESLKAAFNQNGLEVGGGRHPRRHRGGFAAWAQLRFAQQVLIVTVVAPTATRIGWAKGQRGSWLVLKSAGYTAKLTQTLVSQVVVEAGQHFRAHHPLCKLRVRAA